MIFTRIRVGKLSNLEPWGKNPCVTTLSYPTTSIKNCCWWLRQLFVFGSGVAGLSVLAYTHTPPAMNLTMGREMTMPLIPRTGGHHSFPGLFILTQERNSCSLSRTELSWFYPRSSSSADLRKVWLCVFPTIWVVGSTLLLLTHRLGDGNLFLSMVYVCFSTYFVVQNRLFFPTLLVMYADTFLGLLSFPMLWVVFAIMPWGCC